MKINKVIYTAKSLSYVFNRFVFGKQYLVAINNYGVKFKFKTPDAVGRTIYKSGNYEPVITKFVLNTIQYLPEDIVVDVGANIGWYSLLLEHIKNGPGIIYAFEPDPLNYGLLQYNIKINMASKVVAIKQALSDKAEEQATLYKYGDKNLGRHSMLPLFKGNYEKVATITLDDFVEKNNLNGKKIKLIKIDVEGYELPILLGARDVLEYTENLIIEFSPELMLQHKIAPESVVQLLYMSGFNPYLIAENEIISLSRDDLLQIREPLTFLWKKQL